MKSYKIIFSIYALCSIAFFAQAQDTLVLKNNQMVIGKIMEMGQSGVKMKSVFGTQLEIRTYPTMEISSIKYEDTAAANPKSTPQSAKHRRQAIRVDLLPLSANHLDITYETNLMQPISYQITLGIIGVGKTIDDFGLGIRPEGAFIAIGAKLYTECARGERQRSGLNTEDEDEFGPLEPSFVTPARFIKKHGWYAMPEVAVGSYRQTSTNKFVFLGESSRINELVQFARMGGRVGAEWLLGNRFILNVEFGLSYCVDNRKPIEEGFSPEVTLAGNTIHSGLHHSTGIGFGFAF